MKVYISAGFTSQKRLRQYRDELWKMGHQVVSSWLDETAIPEGMDTVAFGRKLAVKDIAEIVAADVFVSDNHEPSTTGGLYIELGVALGRFQHIQVWEVGPHGRSPFHELMDRRFESWDDLLNHVRSFQVIAKEVPFSCPPSTESRGKMKVEAPGSRCYCYSFPCTCRG